MKVKKIKEMLCDLEDDKVVVFCVNDNYCDEFTIEEITRFKDPENLKDSEKGYCFYGK